MKTGANGLASNVAQSEPSDVRRVSITVASIGEKSAPAKTFCGIERNEDGDQKRGLMSVLDEELTQMTLPGTDQACFHTAVTDMTASTCSRGPVPL